MSDTTTVRTQAAFRGDPEVGVAPEITNWQEAEEYCRYLELELRKAREQVKQLERCCDWTADHKPVPRGATLYLCPADDIKREPMKLKIPDVSHTCWYLSHQDAIDAVLKQRGEI